MKMRSTRLFSSLSEETLINLTTEVKEILATGYQKSRNKILSSADLWNIRRQGKLRLGRRYF